LTICFPESDGDSESYLLARKQCSRFRRSGRANFSIQAVMEVV
jgi:hypothetical protein